MLYSRKAQTIKNNIDVYNNLIKHFKIHFNPLLLPKLALIGYQLKNDPSYQIFLSKLQLFDRSAIQRQNLFIQHMKKLIVTLEQHGQQIEEKMFIVGVDNYTQKTIKSCINFQEKKYKYDKILHNRLTDLNQFIFHVQRLDKEPVQEKQCKNLLENQIQKIHRIKNQKIKQRKEGHQSRQQSQKQRYFKLNEFKLKQSNKTSRNINKMLKIKTSDRKYTKSKTQTLFNQNQINYYEMQPILQRQTIIKDQQQDEQFTNQQQKNHKFNTFRKMAVKSQQSHHKSKQNRTNIKKKTFLQTDVNQETDIQSYLRNKKIKNAKSVNYITKTEDRQQNDKITSIGNIHSSRTIMRSSKRDSRNRQSQFFKNKHFLKNNKKSIKTQLQNQNQNQKQEYQQQDYDYKDQQQKQPIRKNTKMKTVKFSEQIIQQKKNFIKPKAMRKFGRKQTKIIFNLSQSKDTQQIEKDDEGKENSLEQNHKNHLGSNKVNRRDGFQQEINPINSRRSVANLKRKGKILGFQANKNLQRLLMQDNIQQMLLQNQLYGRTGQQFQKYKNKGKYISRKLASQGSTRGLNRSKTGKNNILMEVDIDQAEIDGQDKNQFVSSQGFKVNANDLKAIKENYVQIMPYQQKRIAQFYGGENFESINHQFNTNQNGQYYFNRLVVHNARSASVEQYIPYNFTQNSKMFQSLRFDFGKELSKQCNRMQQKDMQSSVMLTNYK